ncbi:swr complex subunit [Agyrium rufum]|nr:swr complex subunit [Agyrium rufum]
MAGDAVAILGLEKPDGSNRPVKKQKVTQKRPGNIPRELFELIGERAPPIAAQEVQRLKPKIKISYAAQQWENASFINPVRKDGLVLKHWRKKPTKPVARGPATPGDLDATTTSNDTEDEAIKRRNSTETSKVENEYHFTKYNVHVNVPRYSDEEYEAHLKDNSWSKDETNYLMELVRDFDLRWVVIADRYDYSEKAASPHEVSEAEGATTSDSNNTALVIPRTSRNMEDLKARYYTIASKIMALRTPLSTMSSSEFELHEKMAKFDPKCETLRKDIAAKLLARSADEIQEEEILLAELKRIVTNEERFALERKDLYSRLEAPPIARESVSTAVYQSSNGLATLMQQLMSADRNKKRRSLMGPNEGASNANVGSTSPAQGATGASNLAPTSAVERARQSQASGSGANKAGPVRTPSGLGPNQRKLSKAEEARFGVSHPERITSGVTFRTARIDKLVTAKSSIQSTKIASALTELGIPMKMFMPTEKVCAEFEKLIGSIQTLLDVRKVSEKVEGEIKILRAMKEEQMKAKDGGTGLEQADVTMGDASGDVEESVDAEGERDDADIVEEGDSKEDAEKMEADPDAPEDADADEDENDREQDEDAEAEVDGEGKVDIEENAGPNNQEDEDDDRDQDDNDSDAEDDDAAEAEIDATSTRDKKLFEDSAEDASSDFSDLGSPPQKDDAQSFGSPEADERAGISKVKDTESNAEEEEEEEEEDERGQQDSDAIDEEDQEEEADIEDQASVVASSRGGSHRRIKRSTSLTSRSSQRSSKRQKR